MTDRFSKESEGDEVEEINDSFDFTGLDEEPKIDIIDEIVEAVTWSTDWTVETIFNSFQRGSFQLSPKFQRRDAWSGLQKSRFIESLVYGLPVPQIVLAESKESRNKFIVLDGKQRLITLSIFF